MLSLTVLWVCNKRCSYAPEMSQSYGWTVDEEHKIGANQLGKRFAYLNDTEMKFRRIDTPEDDKRCITPMTLNPMLHNNDPYTANFLRMVLGGEREYVSYSGWMDVFKDSNASFWKTHLTDPPCHEAMITYFDVYFGETRPPKHHPGYEYLCLAHDSHGVDHMLAHPIYSHPISTGFSGGLTIKSDVGIKMGDILQACLTTRGHWSCESPPGNLRRKHDGATIQEAIEVAKHNLKCESVVHWKHDDATIHEAMDVVKHHLGSKDIPKSPYMSLQLHLTTVGSTTPLLATDEDRAAAKANYKPPQ